MDKTEDDCFKDASVAKAITPYQKITDGMAEQDVLKMNMFYMIV